MPVIEEGALDQELERFEQDMAWIYAHHEALKQTYPNEFVAVYGGQVVAHSLDADTLVQELRQQYGDQASEIAVKFIYKEPPNFVLRLCNC